MIWNWIHKIDSDTPKVHSHCPVMRKNHSTKRIIRGTRAHRIIGQLRWGVATFDKAAVLVVTPDTVEEESGMIIGVFEVVGAGMLAVEAGKADDPVGMPDVGFCVFGTEVSPSAGNREV